MNCNLSAYLPSLGFLICKMGGGFAGTRSSRDKGLVNCEHAVQVEMTFKALGSGPAAHMLVNEGMAEGSPLSI